MTDIEIVRYKIGDSDSALFPADATIQAFITRNEDDLDLAAAELLECLAADSVLLSKAIKIGNYSHDRKGMAEQFRALAEHYRELASLPAVDIAETNWNQVSQDIILRNKTLRGL